MKKPDLGLGVEVAKLLWATTFTRLGWLGGVAAGANFADSMWRESIWPGDGPVDRGLVVLVSVATTVFLLVAVHLGHFAVAAGVQWWSARREGKLV